MSTQALIVVTVFIVFLALAIGLVLALWVFKPQPQPASSTTPELRMPVNPGDATGPGMPAVSGAAALVMRAWGDGDDRLYSSAPFRPGDVVDAQACYVDGAQNAQAVLKGGGIPVAYVSVGTLESNDKGRVQFYQSLGVYDTLAQCTTSTKIMGEPYYEPSKLTPTVLNAYKKIIDQVFAYGFRGIELDNMDFYKVNQEKANTQQAQIDAYVEAIVDYVRAKGGLVYLKNTMHIHKRLAAKATGLITESVGDSDSNACTDFAKGYGAYYGAGKQKPWYDFSYKGGTRCKTSGATAVFVQENGKSGRWRPV